MSDVLILGGGLAGASAALRLARAGVHVRLLEREIEPQHKVCGEFLSIEAQQDLRQLGICPAALGAVPIDRVRLYRGQRMVEAALPFVGQGLSRKLLDEVLLDGAQRAGARVERGVKANLIGDGEARTSAGTCRVRHLFLATGKHDVRGARRVLPGVGTDYIGFKMHWRIGPRQRGELGSAIELALFDGGYAGLQRIADDVMNLCLVVRRGRFIECGGHWEGLLADLMRNPHLAHRLGEGEQLFARPLTIANLPYGFVCDPAAALPGGVYRLGDQAALTAPLTGDGMAIALRSAALAAASVQAGATPAEYHRKLRELVAPQVRRAMALQGMTEVPLAMRAAFFLVGHWPGLLGKIAGMTRLAPWREPLEPDQPPWPAAA